MRNLLKWTLSLLTVTAALVVFAPRDATAHGYGYYGHRYYRPYPVHRYRYPRNAYYRPYYRPYYRQTYRPYYGRPHYGRVYYGGPRFYIGFGY